MRHELHIPDASRRARRRLVVQLTSPYYFNVRMKPTNAPISARLKLLPYGGIFPLPLLIIEDKRASDIF
jgi:hypothetical protein